MEVTFLFEQFSDCGNLGGESKIGSRAGRGRDGVHSGVDVSCFWSVTAPRYHCILICWIDVNRTTLGAVSLKVK